MIYFASTVIAASIHCTQCEHNSTPNSDGPAAGGPDPPDGYLYLYKSISERDAVGRICQHRTRRAPRALGLDTAPSPCHIHTMDRAPPSPPTLRDLLLRSDLGRANPARVDEVLSRATAPQTREPTRAD
jgi:hypothetical protein